MGELLTERLGLIKPNRDTNTPLDIERLNLNMDVLDRSAGGAIVADGVIPPTVELYDGKIIREKGTGRVWMAEKQTNGSFAKKWITWPYLGSFFTSDQYVAYGVYSQVGWLNATIDPNRYSLNSSTSDLNGSSWICPMKGVWSINIHATFIGGSESVGNLGFRQCTIVVNGSTTYEGINSSAVSQGGDFSGNVTAAPKAELVLAQGDAILAELFQNALNPMRYHVILRATMIHPIS